MAAPARRFLVPVLGGCVLAAAGQAFASTPAVTITASGPQPAVASVPWGGSVRFTNSDSVSHTVRVAGDPSSEVKTIAPGASYTATFAGKAGTLRYTIGGGHRRAHGTIDVALSGQLTLEASTSAIVYGQKLALHGHTSAGRMPVTIQEAPLERAAGSKRGVWKDVASVRPGADGSFGAAVSPTVGARFRAVTAATQLRSADVHVHVTPAISEEISPHSVAIGGTLVARARISPAGAGKRAVLARFVPAKKRWVVLASAPISGGHVSIPWKADRTGRLELRVALDSTAISGGFAGAAGSPVQVTIAWPPTTLAVQAVAAAGKARFAPAQLTAHPGRVTITMENLDADPHGVAIRGEGVDVRGRVVVGAGGTSKVTADLAAGKYTLYSSSDGIKSGLVGQLIVR